MLFLNIIYNIICDNRKKYLKILYLGYIDSDFFLDKRNNLFYIIIGEKELC